MIEFSSNPYFPHHEPYEQSQLSTAGTSNTGKLARIQKIPLAPSAGNSSAGGHTGRGASLGAAISLFSDVTKGGTASHSSGGRRKSDRGSSTEFQKAPSLVKDKVSAIEKHSANSNTSEEFTTSHGDVAVRHPATRNHSSMSSFLGPTKACAERDSRMGGEPNKKLFDSFAYDGPETSSAGHSPPPMGMVMGVGRDRDNTEEKEGASLSRSASFKKLITLSTDFGRSRGSFKEGSLLTSLSSPSRYSTEGPCSVSSPQVTPHDQG